MILADYQIVVDDDGNTVSWREFLQKQREQASDPAGMKAVSVRLVADPDAEICCPHCRGKMIRNGRAERTVVDAGVEYRFSVMLFLCPKCREKRQKKNDPSIQYTHRALPENLFPFRRTVTDVMIACGQLGELESAEQQDEAALEHARAAFDTMACSADEATLSKWKVWYGRFRSWLHDKLTVWANQLGLTAQYICDVCSGRSSPGQLEAAVRDILSWEGRISI